MELLSRRSRDPRIEPVELWVPSLAHAQLSLEGSKAEGEQRIFENVEVTLHGGPRDTGVVSQSLDVQDLAMEERSDRQEARESG